MNIDKRVYIESSRIIDRTEKNPKWLTVGWEEFSEVQKSEFYRDGMILGIPVRKCNRKRYFRLVPQEDLIVKVFRQIEKWRQDNPHTYTIVDSMDYIK